MENQIQVLALDLPDRGSVVVSPYLIMLVDKYRSLIDSLN